MKKLIPGLMANSSNFYLTLFILMIVPGIILFFAAQSGSGNLVYVCLAIIVVANAAAVFNKI